MPEGFQFLDASGNLRLDLTGFVGTFVNYFDTTGTASGTHQDDLLIGRKLVYWLASAISDYGGPQLSLDSGTGTISWQYVMNVNNMTAPPPPVDRIYYGGY